LKLNGDSYEDEINELDLKLETEVETEKALLVKANNYS